MYTGYTWTQKYALLKCVAQAFFSTDTLITAIFLKCPGINLHEIWAFAEDFLES